MIQISSYIKDNKIIHYAYGHIPYDFFLKCLPQEIQIEPKHIFAKTVLDIKSKCHTLKETETKEEGSHRITYIEMDIK